MGAWMKLGKRVTVGLSAGVMTLSSLALATNARGAITDVIWVVNGGPAVPIAANPSCSLEWGQTGTGSNRENPATVYCTPRIVFPPDTSSLTTEQGFRVEFLSYADARETQMVGIVSYATTYGIYGFVDTAEQCTYTGQTRHFLDRNVSSPVTLGNGLTLQVFNQRGAALVGGNVREPVNWSGSSRMTQKISVMVNGLSLNSGNNAGKFFCAISGAAIVDDGGTLALGQDRFTNNNLSNRLLIPVRERTAQESLSRVAQTPTLVRTSSGPVDIGRLLTVRTTVGGPNTTGVVSRQLYIGAAETDGGPCTGTLNRPRYYVDRSTKGDRADDYIFAITASDWGGKYLCLYQKVLDTRGVDTTSQVFYAPINPLGGGDEVVNPTPNFDFAGTLTSIRTVSTALRAALQAGQSNQAEIDRLRAQAQELESQVQAAIIGGALNINANQNQAPDGGGQPSEKLLEELAGLQDGLEKINEIASPQDATARSALEKATGYNQLVTPLLPAGTRTASGLELRVESPAKVTRGKYMKVAVVLDPASVRGRMRLYLVRYDDGNPTVILKRVGFISKGSKSKRFRVPRTADLGDYSILTTFEPTTPGQVGVATLTPVQIRR